MQIISKNFSTLKKVPKKIFALNCDLIDLFIQKGTLILCFTFNSLNPLALLTPLNFSLRCRLACALKNLFFPDVALLLDVPNIAIPTHIERGIYG